MLVEHPQAKPPEISKMLGEGWKQLNTAELRQPYEAQAAAARARFVQECAALGIDPQHHRNKRKSADGGGPPSQVMRTSGQFDLGYSVAAATRQLAAAAPQLGGGDEEVEDVEDDEADDVEDDE